MTSHEQPDEFDRAEATDRELERAQDQIDWPTDWLELHGEPLVQPTFAEAVAQEGRAKRAAARRSDEMLRHVPRWWQWHNTDDDEEPDL